MEILVLLWTDEKEMCSGLEPSSTISQVTSYKILLPFARKLGACWEKKIMRVDTNYLLNIAEKI